MCGGGGAGQHKQNNVCDSEVGFYVICVISGELNNTKHCHYICVFNMGVRAFSENRTMSLRNGVLCHLCY